MSPSVQSVRLVSGDDFTAADVHHADRRIAVTLIPVQVFGTKDCCEHNPTGMGDLCESAGYGLMDAVSCWSDCNRAFGHIYRFEDMPEANRGPGETLTVWVDPDEYEAFSKRKFGG